MKTRFINTLLIALIALFSFNSCKAVPKYLENDTTIIKGSRIVDPVYGTIKYKIDNNNIVDPVYGTIKYKIDNNNIVDPVYGTTKYRIDGDRITDTLGSTVYRIE